MFHAPCYMTVSRNKTRLHRKRRIRVKVQGTPERPRLCIFKSLTKMEAQLIDDTNGKTIAQIDSKKLKAKGDIAGAEKVGEAIAKLGKEKGVESVVFDRGGYQYHGKVKSLADGARKGGLKF